MPDPTQTVKLILASRSPRRALLLSEAGYRFTQANPPYEDPPHPEANGPATPHELARQLAYQKAMSLRDHVEPGSVILAADTLCVGHDGRLLGTPTTARQARDIIEHFIQQTHTVITGVALLNDAMTEPMTFADEAQVTLGQLNKVQLDEYLASDMWRGKAGGYNLFERQQAGWPLTVTGDPTTVVGLPMKELVPRLRELGVHPSRSS
ncbi:MAG: hypothetical protein D6751_04845 [Deltaproteobacteria bacterium]|nr:MAG: hypothetical protein D6751_04845 [Deltaproteobacteria bacterium]